MMHVWTIALPGGPYAGHVEGDYARIYLGIAPQRFEVPVDSATDARLPTSIEKLIAAITPAGGDDATASALNTLNVHRVSLCTEPLRTQLASHVQQDALIERMCDSTVNGPLPGATSTDWMAVKATLTANGIGR